MSDMWRVIRYKVTNGAMFFNTYSPIVAVILTAFSLFGTVTPGSQDHMQFINAYCTWYVVMAATIVIMAINLEFYVGTYAAILLGCEGLMYWRMGDVARYFGEMYVLLVATGVLLVLVLLQPKQQSQTVAMMPAGNDAEPSGQDTAGVGITFPAVRARYSFADVVGMAETKQRLFEAGKEAALSRTNGKAARNGVMLSGKPGNGKTFLAEALAGELKLPFLAVSFGDVASKFINNTTEQVVKVFRDAARQAPCLLFIDEIDSLIAERNSASTYEESARTTNAILTELVNIRRSGVLVVAATNFIDRLDPAAVREGRFDFKIEIPAPDAEARRHLIKRKANGRMSAETLETVVRRWEGFSVARISAIVEEACRTEKQGLLNFDAMKVALRTIQGRKGSIAEDTPTLHQLTMSAESKGRLVALARRMDRIQEIEAMGGSVPNGVVFFGPPGTGKTLTARALAKTANWAFLCVSGMDLMSDPSKIDSIVEQASDLRPCIVFIDEAEDVLRDRRYSNSSAITNKLLAAIDGANGKAPDILYIAATNHLDMMDSAALRGGRFTEKIEFALPEESTVLEFLTKWASETKAQLDSGFSLEIAARQLTGNSIANIKEIIQMAVNNAIARTNFGEEAIKVRQSDLEGAIESVQIAGYGE